MTTNGEKKDKSLAEFVAIVALNWRVDGCFY